jgi:hypothetical protein
MDDIPPEIEQYTEQSLSVIHHALRTSRRRIVIGLLAYRTLTSPPNYARESARPLPDGPPGSVASVRQLAREIVMIEENVSRTHATGDPYRNVYTSLIQTHLSKLHDLGVLIYDDDRKQVAADQNLIPVAMVAATTSPIARCLFHSGFTTSQLEPDAPDESTTD